MIYRAVTSRSATQDHYNINEIWKGNCWFSVDAFFISYDRNQENNCLENHICVGAFKHRPVPINHVLCTRCMLCLLQSWRF